MGYATNKPFRLTSGDKIVEVQFYEPSPPKAPRTYKEAKSRELKVWRAPAALKVPKCSTSELIMEIKRLETENAKLMQEVVALRPVYDATTTNDGTVMGPKLALATQKAAEFIKQPINVEIQPASYRRMVVFYVEWARRVNCPRTLVYQFFGTNAQQIEYWKEQLGKGDIDDANWAAKSTERAKQRDEADEFETLLEKTKDGEASWKQKPQDQEKSFDEEILGHYRNLDEDLDVEG